MLKIIDNPKIVRLNWIANVEHEGKILDSVDDLNSYKDHFLSLKSQIRYWWDDQIDNKDWLEPMLADTEKIIVIGYSFPVYNRFTDTKIFEFLRKNFKQKPTTIIEIVGREDKTLERLSNSIRQILNNFNWRHDDIDKTPRIEKILSPEQFTIPYDVPIFWRTQF